MTSKKPPSVKRASLPRVSDRTKAFVKDWTRRSHSGWYDMKRLKEAMMLLVANDEPLGPEWLDHPLQGDWADHRGGGLGDMGEARLHIALPHVQRNGPEVLST
ncbi:MAG: type II toxin-antitoxin system mRNA interferase toxin, RelE/StbE family [Casimicrobiaceae bacterium]